RLPVGLTCLGRAAGIGGGDQVLSCRIENLDAVLEQAERPITYVTEDPANRAGLMIMVNDGPLGNNCANRADATLALEHLGLLGRSNAVGSPEVIVGTPRGIRPRRSSLVPLLDAGDAAVLDTTGARAVEVGCTRVLMARGASLDGEQVLHSSAHAGHLLQGIRVDGIGPSRSRGAAATGSRRSSRGKSEHRAVAGEAERRAPLPCRSDEEAGVRLISSELLCILLALGCDRRSPLL